MGIVKRFATEEYVVETIATQGGTANAVLYTPQELTDEQKAQARANIGIGEPEIITTNYEYTYNGDTNDENNE